ncbi:MAG: hypothetical protein ACI9S8_002328 [Chlamydiales bacterium]|jgi:hypothetical protein
MTCPFNNAPSQRNFDQNQLADHCRFFPHTNGPQNGKITHESMQSSFESLGVQNLRARTMSTALMALLSNKCGHWLPAPESDPERIAVCATHSCSTRIYKPQDGHTDPQQWKRLKNFIGDGSQAFNQDDFTRIGEANWTRSADDGEKNFLTRYLDSSASASEFSSLLEVATDTQKDGKPAISMSRLKHFYNGGGDLFREIAESRRTGPSNN